MLSIVVNNARLARECAEWIREKVCFKSNRTNELQSLQQGHHQADIVKMIKVTCSRF